jgi:DNA-binding NarL/FixJ family response regulator
MAAGDKIRLVVVDDHEVVREGLKRMLETESDFSIVAETGRGADVLDLVARTRPDLVLLDVRLPDTTGAEVCRDLTESFPDVRVLVLSTYTDDALVQACIQAGARGYVIKDIERFSLKESIRSVSRGQAVLSPAVASKVLDFVRGELRPVGGVMLNRRQLAILRLIARGYTNREIAAEIHLSENTVKTHLQAIFAKLGVKNRVEAAIVASNKNLI